MDVCGICLTLIERVLNSDTFKYSSHIDHWRKLKLLGSKRESVTTILESWKFFQGQKVSFCLLILGLSQTNLNIVIFILHSKTINQKEFGISGKIQILFFCYHQRAPSLISVLKLYFEKQIFCLWNKATHNMHFERPFFLFPFSVFITQFKHFSGWESRKEAAQIIRAAKN